MQRLQARSQATGSDTASAGVTTVHDLSLELVGQVTNSAAGVTPATSIQYGYVAYLRGLPIFTADPPSEKTAPLTFYVQTTTTQRTPEHARAAVGLLRRLHRQHRRSTQEQSSLDNAGSFAGRPRWGC